jgi:hypothetical protein
MADRVSEDRDLFSAVGLVVVQWSHVEFGLSRVISRLCGVEFPESAILFTHMSVASRLHILRSVGNLPEFGEAVRELLNKVADSIEHEQMDRDDIVHGLWRQNDRGNLECLKLSARGKKGLRSRLVQVSDVRAAGKRICSLVAEIYDVDDQIRRYFDENALIRAMVRRRLSSTAGGAIQAD